jgi:CheY-like chemotaxis protein
MTPSTPSTLPDGVDTPAVTSASPPEAPPVQAESSVPLAVPSPLNLAKMALVIDDEPANRDFLVRLIAQAKYESHGAASGKEGLDLAKEMTHAPLLIVIDGELPDINGLELIHQFRLMFPAPTKLVMATMHDNPTMIHKAFEQGCDAFLVKPHGFMELYKRLLTLPDDPSAIQRIVIDKYGIRPFKGA